MYRLSTLLISISLAISSFAGCIQHDLLPRHAQNIGIRQAPTDESSAAQSTDPATECIPYGNADVQAMLPTYPSIWNIANLSQPTTSTDTEAIALFKTLNATIPNIAPKGTFNGNFTGVNYTSADPDCWYSWNGCDTPKLPGLQPDIVRCPEPNTWGYTFDDGPNCSHNALYDYWLSNNQKVTLFYIGSNMFDWPYQAQRGLVDGHEICAHTWSHNYMTALNNEQAFAELYYPKRAIKDLLGITVQCWRPPYGDVDDRIRYIAQALGMSSVLWNFDTDDWKFATIGIPAVEANYNEIIQAGKNGTFATEGTIVLEHELNNETMSLAIQFYPQIQQAFKEVMPVAVCMNNSQPYLETQYVYPNFAQWVAGTHSGNIPPPTASPNAPVSIPLKAGFSSTVIASIPYNSPSNTAGVSGTPSSSSSSTKKSNAMSRNKGAALGLVGMTAVGVVAAAFVLLG